MLSPVGQRINQSCSRHEQSSGSDFLFEPLRIGSARLENRIVVAPMGSGRNIVSEAGIAWYRQLTKGQPGLLLVQATNVEWINEGVAARDLRRLPEAMHGAGIPLCIQIVRQDFQWRSATDFPISEIELLYKSFEAAARKCCEAGFDGIEIHGAHGYLINQFFSNHRNRREDVYGGTLENRSRLAATLVSRIREAVRTDYLIAYRHTPIASYAQQYGRDYAVELDYGIEESRLLLKELVRCGVDVIDISPAREKVCGDLSEPFMELGGYVAAVGGLDIPENARTVLARGYCHLVTIGRGLIADPLWPEKVRNNREEDIVPCIRCDECFNALLRREPVTCHRETVLESLRPYLTSGASTSR